MSGFKVEACRCGCTRSGHHYTYARGAMRVMACKTHRSGAERCVEFTPVEDVAQGDEGRPADVPATPAGRGEVVADPVEEPKVAAPTAVTSPPPVWPLPLPGQRVPRKSLAPKLRPPAVQPAPAEPVAQASDEVLSVWDGWLCELGRRYRDAGPHGAPQRCGCQLAPIRVTVTRRPS